MYPSEGIGGRHHAHDVKMWRPFRLSKELPPRVANVHEQQISPQPISHSPQSATALFVYNLQYQVTADQWPLLLTWFNFNPSMDK